MKKVLLSCMLLCFLAQFGFSQNRTCGTMESFEHQCQNDSTLTHRRDSIEMDIQKFISVNTPFTDTALHIYPAIIGFIPTGDPYIDAINWQEAKKKLYETNPELYIVLTRNITPTNQTKKP